MAIVAIIAKSNEAVTMTYPGGKNGTGVYQKLINLMPPHRIYIEPFLGGGAIMRLKRPATSSIGIDVDGDAISSWQDMVTATPNLTILRSDALDWLSSRTFSSDTLIYCDPPYLMSTRSSHQRIYRYELSDEQHARLLEIIKGLTCMVMISGYYSELYARELSHWRTEQFTTRTRGGRLATEWVWLNFPLPLELHDYQYLGENFRERERIKRKRNRWKSRLLRMDDLERHAILSAISEIRISSLNPTMPTSPSPDLAMGAGTPR